MTSSLLLYKKRQKEKSEIGHSRVQRFLPLQVPWSTPTPLSPTPLQAINHSELSRSQSSRTSLVYMITSYQLVSHTMRPPSYYDDKVKLVSSGVLPLAY